MEAAFAQLMLSGSAYVEAVSTTVKGNSMFLEPSH